MWAAGVWPSGWAPSAQGAIKGNHLDIEAAVFELLSGYPAFSPELGESFMIGKIKAPLSVFVNSVEPVELNAQAATRR